MDAADLYQPAFAPTGISVAFRAPPPVNPARIPVNASVDRYYSGLLNMLANPVYAGAYAYGRNGRETKLEDGRRRVRNGVRLPREKWRVLLHDRHEGYIDWDEFERNLCVIANNANRKGQAVQGAVRGGAALLPGLLRCGHCGRKLKVRYRADLPANQYYCVRPIEEDNAGKVCTIISGGHLDRAVSEALLQILAPPGSRRHWPQSTADRIVIGINADKPNWR